MKKLIYVLVFQISFALSYSQHLYPEKFDGCRLASFCLDCGDTKAESPKAFIDEMIHGFDKKSLSKITGTIEVQVLVDDNGKPCLLSSVNQSNITSKKLGLQKAVNNTSVWQPAVSKGKNTNSSVSLVLIFDRGSLSVKRRQFDTANESNFKSVGTPGVKGSSQDKLAKSWTIFTQQNSELPWDMTRAISNDADGNIWIGTDNGVVKLSDGKWEHYNSKNTLISPTPYNKDRTQSVRNLAVDKSNSKWFVIGWAAYKYDNTTWTKYDSLNSPINWARKIFVDHSNNVWFTSWDGVAKFDGKNWSVINKANSNLPTDKTLGVYADKKNRVWIGTFEGNVVIENGTTKVLNDMDSPLSKAFISKIVEDKKGNMWFSLYNDKSDDAGIYLQDMYGKWTRIAHSNPKLFRENTINDFFLDEDDGVLWITLNGIGVVSYKLVSKEWEIYTNQNSNVPSIHCEQITKDKDGAIWIATYAGVIKLNQ